MASGVANSIRPRGPGTLGAAHSKSSLTTAASSSVLNQIRDRLRRRTIHARAASATMQNARMLLVSNLQLLRRNDPPDVGHANDRHTVVSGTRASTGPNTSAKA